ncbi:unnamed protein product [Linum trigynum]|uniref:Reverse transcriptase domain-containing protein n=1 Tax=Linum trigynum TaxID=586398 RepID=A0AAV2FR41_9ROSI
MHYRALNLVTIKDRFPIPTVDDMLDEWHGASYFHQARSASWVSSSTHDAADVPKTAFRTHSGHYEYLVMSFGLCNALSTFQAIMNEIFRPLLHKSVFVFFDDILVYNHDKESHLNHVRQVFHILRHYKFFIKFSKCAFGMTEIEYLGHFISVEGVQVDPRKITAMVDWPTPTNSTELRGFLGLAGYYRKFVRNYRSIARALTTLLKRGQFVWSNVATSAFQVLKEAMTSTPVLALPEL